MMEDEISIYEDVYEQLQDMIDPHIKSRNGMSCCSEDSLTASVVGSVDYLLHFWLLNRKSSGVKHP